MESVTLPIVLATAAVDAINPCAIGVLIVLLSVLLKHSQDKKRLALISTVYISVVYVVYLLSGLGLIWFQSFLIGQGFALYMGVLVGVVVILGGLIEIKDFFWYGKGFSLQISPNHAKKIHHLMENISVSSALVLGVFVAIVELPCTGGPYLAITTLLANSFDATALVYLLIYNFIFVLPLIIICVLAYQGVSTNVLKDWKEDTKKWMRLSAGLLMVCLGIFLIWYYLTRF